MLRMMHLHLLFAVWVLVAAATAATTGAGQSKPQYDFSEAPTDPLWARLVSDSDQPYASIIATISSRKLIQARFRHVCGQPKGSTISTSVIDVPDVCWRLQGACHRVFKSSILGVSTGALLAHLILRGTLAVHIASWLFKEQRLCASLVYTGTLSSAAAPARPVHWDDTSVLQLLPPAAVNSKLT